MTDLIVAILELLSELVKGTRTKEEAARALIDAAFSSGVPANELGRYLTERATEDAEFAADLAQWAKLYGPKL